VLLYKNVLVYRFSRFFIIEIATSASMNNDSFNQVIATNTHAKRKPYLKSTVSNCEAAQNETIATASPIRPKISWNRIVVSSSLVKIDMTMNKHSGSFYKRVCVGYIC